MIWNCFGSLDSDERIFSKWQTNWKRSSNIWIGRARYRPENSAESLPTMNINSSSNGLSWTAPDPHFLVCFCFLFLLLLLFSGGFYFFVFFYFLFIYIFSLSLSLKKSFLLRCVRSNARLSSWKAESSHLYSACPSFFCFCWPYGQKRLIYLTRMRRGSNNRETPKGFPSSKNNRQLVTCRPFRDSCMRTKPNSYRHGSYRLGRVYRQGSKTLFHAYGHLVFTAYYRSDRYSGSSSWLQSCKFSSPWCDKSRVQTDIFCLEVMLPYVVCTCYY